MENLKWGTRAKTVSWIHIFLIALSLIWAIWLATLYTIFAESVKHELRTHISIKNPSVKYKVTDGENFFDERDSMVGFESNVGQKNAFGEGNIKVYRQKDERVERTVNLTMAILWIMVSILILGSAIELWATIMLLIATKPSTGANDCMRKCKIWMSVTIIMLLLNLTNILLFPATPVPRTRFIMISLDIGLRAIFVPVVFLFMKEQIKFATKKCSS